MTLKELKAEFGWKEKLALYVLWRWLKEELMFGKLTGWKTKAGGLGLLLTGTAGVLLHVGQALGAVSEGKWDTAWWYVSNEAMNVSITTLGMGLTALGLAHKIERAATGTLSQELEARNASQR